MTLRRLWHAEIGRLRAACSTLDRGFDVVIHAEKVRRIVFVFQGDEAIVIAAVSLSRDGVALVGDVVTVSSGGFESS